MSIFGRLFSHKSKTAVLIDIGSASIGAAYASFSEKSIPEIWYTAREEVAMRTGEPAVTSLERSLIALLERMIRDGSPVLARDFGRSTIDEIHIGVAAPWQETKISIRSVEHKTPFTFSKAIITEAFATPDPQSNEKRIVGEHAIIATLLDGYETNKPFGKRASRADLVVLTSTLEELAAVAIKSIVAKAYHRRAMRLSGFAYLAYSVFRDVYAHEKDYLLLDITGEATDASLVKRGILVDTASSSCGINEMVCMTEAPQGPVLPSGSLSAFKALMPDASRGGLSPNVFIAARKKWRDGFSQMLTNFATRFPLPRTIFVLADKEVQDFFHKLITDTALPGVRLSDEPFAVVPVTPDQFEPYVHTNAGVTADVFLSMVALFSRKNIQHLEAVPKL